MRFLVEPWEKASTRASLKFMRVFALLTVLFAVACSHDLDGFSSGGEQGSSGPTLRTQAAAKANGVTSFELTPSGGTREGDLLWYVVLTLGRVVTPAGLTQVESIQNACIPSVIWLYSRVATESTQATQKFELEAAADIDATLLVVSGVDPTLRAHAVKGIDIPATSFQAEPLPVGASDVPGTALFTVLFGNTTGPTGASPLASNGSAKFFTVPVASSGAVTLPAMPVSQSCGTVITALFKNR